MDIYEDELLDNVPDSNVTAAGLPIPGCSNYLIFPSGIVKNRSTGRELRHSHTLQGAIKVSIKGDEGRLRTYSVKRLVAESFLPPITDMIDVAEPDLWNTPIQLDGNQDNVHVFNLAWRPRNFAHRYSRQFLNDYGYYHQEGVLNVSRELAYENIYDAAITDGVLMSDILLACYWGGGEEIRPERLFGYIYEFID
jgi:hypothetical protein